MLALAGCAKVVIQVPAGSLFTVSGGQQAVIATEQTPAAAQPSSETAAAPDAPSAAPAETSAASPASQPAQSAPAPASEPAASAPAAQTDTGAPSTKEEIVSYYVTAYNKIASDAKTLTRTYDYTKNYNNIVEVGGNERLASLAQSLMNSFMKENSTPEEGDASKLPPTGVTTLSVTPAQVGTATCKDNGATYEIVLTSTGTDDKYEEDPVAGQGSAGVIGPLLARSDVEDPVKGLIKFEGLHMRYATAKVTATVEKASGHITELKFDSPCVLHFDKVTAFVVVNVSDCNLGLEFMQNWTIAY